MNRLTARTENGLAYLVNVKPDEQEVDSPYKNTLQCILDCFERLAHYEDLEEQGRLMVLQSEKEPFDCQHCKHLMPSDKTNRLFCSYHGEGEHQYEVFRDDYCSYFERAEAEAALKEAEQK